MLVKTTAIQILLCVAVGAMVVSLAVRNVGGAFLFSDEAFSWRVASRPVGELLRRAAADTHPPLHFLLLKGWMNVWGDCPLALRGLSTLAGILTVPAVYLAVIAGLGIEGRRQRAEGSDGIEGSRQRAEGSDALARDPRSARFHLPTAVCPLPIAFGALAAAGLAAIHAVELTHGQIARMYALGALLTAVSTWLLLKALGSQRDHAESSRWANGSEGLNSGESSYGGAGWWVAYGVSAAALCLTHNFGLFTVAAQGMFVAGRIVGMVFRNVVGRGQRAEGSDALARESTLHAQSAAYRPLPTALYFTMAMAIAVAIYSPWIAPFRAQAARVQESFWVQEASFTDVAMQSATWATGIDNLGLYDAYAWLAMAGALSLWALLKGPPAARLFWLMAALPWAATILISTVGGRPLLQERYLVFAHVGLLMLVGTAIASLRSNVARVAVAVLAFVPVSVGTVEFMRSLPREPAAMTRVAAFLKERHRPGDLVLTPAVSPVFCTKYYLQQIDAEHIEVRCPHRVSFGRGHVNHVAALQPDDVLLEGEPPPANIQRVWRLTQGQLEAHVDWLDEWRLLNTWEFASPAPTREMGAYDYVVQLYKRPDAAWRDGD